MQGRELDMDKLIAKNELMPAIGNARVNARGDEIGSGGAVVRSREEIMTEYYEKKPKARATQIVEDHPEPQTQNTFDDIKEIRGYNESKRKT